MDADIRVVLAALTTEVLELKLRYQHPQASDEEIAALLPEQKKLFWEKCRGVSPPNMTPSDG